MLYVVAPDGGSSVTGYQISAMVNGGAAAVIHGSWESSTALAANISELTGRTNYAFAVQVSSICC